MEARNARFTRIQARGKRHQARLAHLGHLGPLPRLFRAKHSKRASAGRFFFLFSPSIPSAQAREENFDFWLGRSFLPFLPRGGSSLAANTETAQTHDPGYRCLPTLPAAKIPDNRVVGPSYPPHG